MKKLIAFTFLILIGCKNFNPENKLEVNNQVTDEDIYEIVNFVLEEHDKAMEKDGFKINPYKYILDKDLYELFTKSDSINIFETDTIFSKEDKKYIQHQIDNRKDFRFKSNFIKTKKIISSDTIYKILHEPSKYPGNNFYERYHNKYCEGEYYSIGLPIFSKDKKTVFIKFDSFGSGYTLIYKKINNKWEYYCQFSNWIA